MKFGKTELIRRVTDVVRNGWSNAHLRDLIESLWRDPYSMRTSGFAIEGGTNAIIQLYLAFVPIQEEQLERRIHLSIKPVRKKFDFYQFREVLTYHKKYEEEVIGMTCDEGLLVVYYDFDDKTFEQVLKYIYKPQSGDIEELYRWSVVISFIYFDAEAQEVIYWGDNRHGSWWNPWMHHAWHQTFNSMRESGLEFTDLIADGDGSSDTHAQFGVSEGSCFHEDIYKEVDQEPAPADFPVFWFKGAELYPRIYDGSVNSLVVDGTLCYNDAGTVKAATDGYFVMYHIFYTNCIYHPFISVMGQHQYDKVSTATVLINSEIQEVKDLLPHQNMLHIGTLLFQTSALFTNQYHTRLVSQAYGVITDMSVTGDGSAVTPVKLVNDEETPDAGKIYGTDPISGEKGWVNLDPRLFGRGEVLYLHTEDSEISGYKQALMLQPDDAMTSYTALANSGTGNVLIKSFATEPGFPGVVVIAAGPWLFDLFMAVTGGTSSSVVVKVYKRTTGNVETELFNFEESITEVGATEHLKAVPQSQIELASDDRLLFKFYHKNTSPSSQTMHLFLEGDETAEYMWSNIKVPDGGRAYVDDVYVTEDPQFPIDYLHYTKGGVEHYVTEIPKPNGIISGGIVTWQSGLTFLISPCAYYINGTLYTTTSATVTLETADPDDPRIDIIIVDSSETVTYIKGEANANPQKPVPDPVTQIELTQVLIPAGATVPGGTITDEIVYDENVEWTGSQSGTTLDLNSVTSPFHESKCAEITNINNNDTITFVAGAAKDITDYETFLLYIKLKAIMSSSQILYVAFFNGTSQICTEQVITLNKSLINTWQNYTITLSGIAFTGSAFDRVRFRWSKTGTNTNHAGFWLDYIKFHTSVTIPEYIDHDNYVDELNFDAGTRVLTLGRTGTLPDLTKVIPTGQIQSDWDQADNGLADYIKNKPTIPTEQIQSDWEQEDDEALDYIKNKPTIPECDNYEYWTLRAGTKLMANVEYGYLYNWWAATDSRNIAPEGWHVPTPDDFYTLQQYLGGYDIAGGKLKETGLEYWDSPNTGATNESGFNLRGAGARSASFADIKSIGGFWNDYGEISGEPPTSRAVSYCSSQNDNFYSTHIPAQVSLSDMYVGFSLRLVKDDSTDTGTVTGNDGKIYPTVKIGDQVWLAANLMETKYRNGDSISGPTFTNGEWAALTTEAYCEYGNAGDPEEEPIDLNVYSHDIVEFAGDGVDITIEEISATQKKVTITLS